jgi:hypothetical protein
MQQLGYTGSSSAQLRARHRNQNRGMKPRDPDASIRVALNDVRCPRYNGHGRIRITALTRQPSI